MLPAPKSDFIGLEGVAHLATGGQPPLLLSQRTAFEAYAADKAQGQLGYRAHWREGDLARARLAEMTGLPAGDFAFVGSASTGLAQIVSAIDWREGDYVVAGAEEFASGRFALARLQKLGVEARFVAADAAGLLPEEELLAACDSRTRLVYVSQVSYLTGQQLDMARLSAGLAGLGAWLVNDASHALGVLPVEGALADFVISCCYKWLLSSHMGILAWNRRRRADFEPLGIGWNSAEETAHPTAYDLKPEAVRAELGNPNHLPVYLLRRGLDYLSGAGIEAIAGHSRSLGEVLREALAAGGRRLLTPEDPARRGGSICFAEDDPEAFMQAAAKENILVWGDHGRIRASVHLFVSEEDIARFLDWMTESGRLNAG